MFSTCFNEPQRVEINMRCENMPRTVAEESLSVRANSGGVQRLKSPPKSTSTVSNTGNLSSMSMDNLRDETPEIQMNKMCNCQKPNLENKTTMETVFAGTRLPNIPKLSKECASAIKNFQKDETETFKGLVKDKAPKYSRPPKKKKARVKINGFIAYRAFHSRNVPTEHQGELSLFLAKEWKENPEIQVIWQRFAIEYNSTTQRKKFVTWLLENKEPKGNVTIVKSQESPKIENVYHDSKNGTANSYNLYSAPDSFIPVDPLITTKRLH